MTLEKKGLIYCPSGEHDWEYDTFMTPHAMSRGETIRIYGGVRDRDGISRIKYIDVDGKDPQKIINISDHISLNIGEAGCFDDNGVILGDIIQVEDKLYMYYVGFQHVQKVKFYAFSGLAISTDGGDLFESYSSVPIMDRTASGRFGRCIHTVLLENGIFKCWYAVINDWKVIGEKPYPVYDIWYTESNDGIHFPAEDTVRCITTEDNEYRIGRPKVYKTNNGYEMFYTRDLITKEYLPGYAVSEDGIIWERRDKDFILPKSSEGWDSQMTCYPVRVDHGGRNYLFYGGNDMGRSGVGYAELIM